MQPQVPQEENIQASTSLPPVQAIPASIPSNIDIKKPRKWSNLVIPTVIVFAVLIGFSAYINFSIGQVLTSTFVIGSIVMALGISACFFLVAWIISVIGRKFGMTYAVVTWAVLVIIGAGVIFYSSFGRADATGKQLMSQGDSIVLPPGTDLSQFPSYIQIDRSRIVNIPGGGMSIPKSAIKFVMAYDECLTTTDMNAQKGCANKYSIERKDVGLCKSMIQSSDPDMVEYIANLQQECIAQYAITYKDPALCDSLESKFLADACFGGIIDQISDPSQCKIVFQKDIDIKDCTDGVARNQQKRVN